MNTGVVKVPDPRLDYLHDHFKVPKKVPIEVHVLDFVPIRGGESGRKGMSPQLLGQMRACDALIIVVRAFDDPSVPHPGGAVDPAGDLRNMLLELSFADIEVVERRLERIESDFRKGKKEDRAAAGKEKALLEGVREVLEGGGTPGAMTLTDEQERILTGFGFLTMKPAVVVVNAGEGGEAAAGAVAGAASGGAPVVAVSGRFELEMASLEEDERREFLESLGHETPAAERVLGAVLGASDTVSFFTTGKDEVRAWAVKRGSDAVTAAGKVHTDMARGFIRAEVVAFDDLRESGGIQQARERGKLRLEGKSYVVRDGDVVTFRFNV
ncbi:MAG: DUF933 domain-containing protein [bacterium]